MMVKWGREGSASRHRQEARLDEKPDTLENRSVLLGKDRMEKLIATRVQLCECPEIGSGGRVVRTTFSLKHTFRSLTYDPSICMLRLNPGRTAAGRNNSMTIL
jgi:hypothetical protein